MGGNWQMRTPYPGPALPASPCGACRHEHTGFGGVCAHPLSSDVCRCPQWVDATLDANNGANAPVPPASAPAATAGTDFPRRNQMLKWTTGERAIQDAVDVVERMGADVRLTDAVILLGKARDRVADFVDGVAPESTVYPPVAEHHDFAKLLDAYERAAYGCGDYQPVEERGNYTQLVAAKRAARAQVESFVTTQATALAALRARVEELQQQNEGWTKKGQRQAPQTSSNPLREE